MDSDFPPPNGLGRAGKALWAQYIGLPGLAEGSHKLKLLETACQHADVAATLDSAISSDGAVFKDRWGQPKAHSAVRELRGERKAMIDCLEAIGIVVEAEAERPKGVKGRPF